MRLIILSLMLLSLSVSAMALTIDVYPLHVQNSAGDNVSIVVRVTENSTPLSNMAVNFITNLGTLNSASTLTNASGYGRVFLRSTDSGIATLNTSVGSLLKITNITFSPTSPKSIIIPKSEKPVTAGNITTVRIRMLDQFGNVNDTAAMTLNLTFEDVFGNTLKETQLIRKPYNLTNIHVSRNLTDGGAADIVLTNSATSDQNVILAINSTIAGNISISASCDSASNNTSIKVLADEVNKIILTHTPTIAYANNQDIYKLIAQPVDQFLNPIIPDSFPINEQVIFYSGSRSDIFILNQEGKATDRFGPTPYVENITINATYKNAGGYTNITNSTTLEFIPGSNLSLTIYCSPDTLLTQNLHGNHESTVKVVALDQWGHTLPGVNLTIATTNSTVGYLSLNGVNATTIHATTNDLGKATLNFFSSTVPGTTTIIATAGNATVSAPITTKNVPFVSTNVSIEPESLKSGGIVNVTTVVSVEGDLQVTRPAANAMLVLDRSGSMDPDYYAGTPLDVVLVIDRSGSMDGDAMLAAKTASKNFATNLVSNSQLGVVSFAWEPFLPSSIDLELTPLNSSKNLLLVSNSIDKMHSVGGTAMGEGMADANSMLVNNGRSDSRKVMILLTDGLTNQGIDQQGTAAVDLAKTNDITIYTIGLGNEIDESLLRSIASNTGGKYYAAPSSSDLASIYNAIAQEICDYDITDIEYGFEGFTPYSYSFNDSISIQDSYILSFEGYDLDDVFDASPFYGGTTAGECLIKVDGENFRLVPSASTPANSNLWKTYQYDITNYIHAGENSISFYDYYDYTGSRDYYDYYKDYYPNPNPSSIGNNRVRNVVISGSGNQIKSYTTDTALNENGYVLSFNKPLSSDYFEDTFEINESINDLKVKLQWEHSSANLDLQLISPSKKIYGIGYNDTGYYPGADSKSEYIWISPLSGVYPDSDTDTVEIGDWTVRVTGIGVNDVGSWQENFSVSTYIDKKSAAKLSSHAFISSFDESRGDKAGLALYSFEGNSLSASQSSYILKNSTWVGYFTVQTTGRYNFDLSWDDSSNIEACLYDGTDLLDSSSGAGACEVSSVLFAGETYYLDITKGAASTDDTHFVVNVTTLPLDTVMTAYYDSTVTPRFRTWNDSQWSIEKSAKNVGAYPYFVLLESSPVRSEIMMVTGDSDNDINVQIWNGISWGSVSELSNYFNYFNNYYENFKRGFDVKYEQLSGDAVVVYMNRSINVSIPQYKIWDGSSWSSASATASKITGPGEVRWVRLEASPNSDEMILATLDSSNYIRAQVWNGNSWGSPVEITKNAKTSIYQCFDIAYEQSTGRAMVVWADSSYVKYRIWNGVSWGSEQNLYSFSNSVCWLKLAADLHSNNMILVSQDIANDIYANTWTGSSWSSSRLLENNAGTSSRRTVDVAFEQSSETGLVVWGDTTSTPKYETWNGVSWSNEASASNFGSGYPMWVQLTPDPSSDEIFLMTSDDSYDLNIQKWTGSSWSSATEVETSSSNSYECFDIAYNSQEASVQSTPVLWTEWTAEVTSTLNNDSLAHLGNSIDTITADGLTAIDEGLFVANNELSYVNGSSTIVLMTDGLDNAGYHSLLKEAYKAKENNTIIYTVGFGKSESEVDPILLEIANVTGGEYYFAPNSSVLKDIFKGIADQITNFSAQGPVLNLQVPHNYATSAGIVGATYISGSSNFTTGDRSSFVTPKYPSRGNAEPSITTLSNRSVLSWQLPTLSTGEKWGVWYQMVVEGTGYVPLVMTGSNISYMNVAGEDIESSVPGGGSAISGSSANSDPYPLGSFTITASKPLMLINESSELTLEVRDITGNYTSAYVILYTNLGSLNGQQNRINVTVDGRRTLTFSSIMAGNAHVIACAYNVNNVTDTKQCDKLLVIRPKGMIRIN
ncbi:MAG: VWA domain-containing protein [Methanomethylovorans sp.]|uniref:VWA domain-containing protein n=1 Tax=Methanomethylovorans sp. TaxID=2758717 RepID=UPI0035312DEB